MLAYLRGEVVSSGNGVIILDVGGVGYEINVSSATVARHRTIGETIKLPVSLNVREDGVFLYGFYSVEEKNMFNMLTSISGIGPKAGLAVLSGMELSSLAVAIITEDSKTISKIKGIGKKTAERIVLELKEKVSAESCLSDDGTIPTPEILIPTTSLDKIGEDAVGALRTLGLTQQEAVRAVQSVRSGCNTLEETVAGALRSLTR